MFLNLRLLTNGCLHGLIEVSQIFAKKSYENVPQKLSLFQRYVITPLLQADDYFTGTITVNVNTILNEQILLNIENHIATQISLVDILHIPI